MYIWTHIYYVYINSSPSKSKHVRGLYQKARRTWHESPRGGTPNHHRFPERPGVQTTKRTVRICTWLSSIDILARLGHAELEKDE